jgi:hypothetical protein
VDPTPTLTIFSSASGRKTPTVSSARFDVKARSRAPSTRTPATPGNPSIECVKTPRVQSMTSTASFTVWAT